MRPQTSGLAKSLSVGSSIIALLAVLAVAWASIGLLGQLAEQQAMSRAEIAGTAAREYLLRVTDGAVSAAQALSERPTLERLLLQRNIRGLRPYLDRYSRSSGVYACAVFNASGLLVAGGADVPWDEVGVATEEQGDRFLLASRKAEQVLTGAVVDVERPAGMRIVVLRAFDDKLLAELQEQVEAGVNIVNFATYTAPPDDPFTALHDEAILSGRATANRIDDLDVYAATVPLSATTGELIALIDVQLDAEEFDSIVSSLAWRLILIALAILGIAAVAGIAYGKTLARPLEDLQRAADRIGRGDFSVAVPSAGVSEIESLAQTMNEMRHNLVDITATLRRRDAEARAVLAGVVEGVYAVDADRTIRYANEQVARMLGMQQDAIVGRFCGDVLRPEAVNGVRPCERDCPIVAARFTGQGQAAERICRADGNLRSVVIVSSAPVEGQQVQVLRDETELESVRRARDSVLANISHEFRTPLAAQLASIELLQDGLEHLTKAEQRELFENLERGVLRLMRLIDNLLESVRIEAGQLGIRAQTVDLAHTAEEAAALVRPLLGQRRQSIEFEWPADMPTIVGDGQRLIQVFVNLLANAGKYAPENSVIRIGGELRGERFAFWVEDEGVGITEADPGTVFQRFQRAGETEPDAAGLGLGLWIVRSIVERHGGDVTVERTPAQRTRFLVQLPVGEKP